MTTEEILEILEEKGVTPELCYNTFDYKEEQLEAEKQPEEFKVEILETEGGSEGGGEYVHVVIKIVEFDKYFMANACYMSGNGVDYWEKFEEVYPVQRTVTFYEPKPTT